MSVEGAERASVRGVLGVPEFRALLSATALSLLGDQVTRIAVSVLVYQQTDSAFFASATMACSFLTWLVGGPFLSALADRWPRKRLMLGCDVARAALVACLVIPGLPLWVVFAVLLLAGLLSPPFESARAAVMPDVLEGEAYRTANTLTGAVKQGSIVLGFLAGGLLVTVVDPHGALAIDAATFLLSAILIAGGVKDRPAPPATGSSLASETLEGFGLVARSPRLRVLLAYGALGTVPFVAPEGLAVPVADVLGGGGGTAGVLTAALPAGFLIGSALVLRVPAERRDALLPSLVALSCVPLLLAPFADHVLVTAALWALTGGFAASQLIANASYVLACPAHARGRAFGVAASTIMATQGLVLLLVGGLGEVVDPRSALAIVGGVALVVVGALRLGARLPSSSDIPDTLVLAQAPDQSCRSTVG